MLMSEEKKKHIKIEDGKDEAEEVKAEEKAPEEEVPEEAAGKKGIRGKKGQDDRHIHELG